MRRPIFMPDTGATRPLLTSRRCKCWVDGSGPRVMGLVVEWALQHRDELLDDWRLARESAPLNRIAPLV